MSHFGGGKSHSIFGSQAGPWHGGRAGLSRAAEGGRRRAPSARRLLPVGRPQVWVVTSACHLCHGGPDVHVSAVSDIRFAELLPSPPTTPAKTDSRKESTRQNGVVPPRRIPVGVWQGEWTLASSPSSGAPRAPRHEAPGRLHWLQAWAAPPGGEVPLTVPIEKPVVNPDGSSGPDEDEPTKASAWGRRGGKARPGRPVSGAACPGHTRTLTDLVIVACGAARVQAQCPVAVPSR